MCKTFLSNTDETPAVRVSLDAPVASEPERESVRLLAIGSRRGVLNIIHTLHRLRFADAGAWSPLLPGPNPGEVMSVLTLSFWVD